MATVVCPPARWPADGAPALFLAGSIEMGAATPWQDRAIAALDDLSITILNPRRPDWDASWRQSIDDPRFREQVEWELDGLDHAALVAMYFDPGTRSPITLLELGLVARGGRLVVACPDGFWRKGNIEIVCARHGVPLLPGLDPLLAAIRERMS
jgi:hypothetical protein